MDFIQHSISWAKGELFEATIVATCGIGIALIALLFWRLGSTPGAKAMLIPFAVAGLIFSASGISGYLSNQQRIKDYEKIQQEDLPAFVVAEKERVEGFASIFTFTQIFASVCFTAAVLMFWMSLNPHLRAVALGLAVLGSAGLIIDFFAKERSDIYYKAIQDKLDSSPAP